MHPDHGSGVALDERKAFQPLLRVARMFALFCFGGRVAREISLTKGKTAIVDDTDYELVCKYTWYAIERFGIWYARGRVNGKFTYMHRFILDAPNTQEVDHIDGDGLNNRRSNIRLASRSQNAMNRGMGIDNKAGFKGVHRTSCNLRPYRATIRVQGKSNHLGYFENPEEAARAYNIAAINNFGEFAKLNLV